MKSFVVAASFGVLSIVLWPTFYALAQDAKVARGIVTTVAASSLTIKGNSGSGSTFTQTFTIDERTRVFAKGAGTAAAKGGRLPISDLVANGDRVSVYYEKAAGGLHASDVRVTMKAAQ
jgi:Domain of unknown function (DUF5666)